MNTEQRLIPRVGEKVRRYLLLNEIGRGGFGVVFRAHDPSLQAEVAIKVMIPPNAEQATVGETVRRFEQEARAASALDHPCALKIRDYGLTDHGFPFFVSEFVRGKQLDYVIGRRGISVQRTIRIAKQVLSCLAEAHHLGIVHRDLKPPNIMLQNLVAVRDVVKILDFGVAKVSAALGGIETDDSHTFGTTYYMSSEQCRAIKPIDGRADLYSLGLIIAECISGRRVIQTDDPIAALYLNANRAPLEFEPAVAKSQLFPVIQKATAKDRDERYPDAISMLHALAAVETGMPVSGPEAVSVVYDHGWTPNGTENVPPNTAPELPPVTPQQLVSNDSPAEPSRGSEAEIARAGATPEEATWPLGARRRSRSRWPLVLLLGLVLAGGASLWWVVALEPNGPDRTSGRSGDLPDTSPPPPPDPIPIVAAIDGAQQLVLQAFNEAELMARALLGVHESVPWTRIATLEGTRGARVTLGEELLCRMPCSLIVPVVEETLNLRFSRPRYVERVVPVDLARFEHLTVHLERVEPSAEPPEPVPTPPDEGPESPEPSSEHVEPNSEVPERIRVPLPSGERM